MSDNAVGHADECEARIHLAFWRRFFRFHNCAPIQQASSLLPAFVSLLLLSVAINVHLASTCIYPVSIFLPSACRHVHFLGPYPAGDYNLSALSPSAPGSSFMPDVMESDWLKLPADISASGFYITNA